VLRQLRIGSAEHDGATIFSRSIRIDDLYGARKFQRKFVEKWRVKGAAYAGNLRELGQGEPRFGEILLAPRAAVFAKKRKVYGGASAQRA